ncbi:ABC transporter ATP-binding protein [Schinkia sp. CFF1]
MYKNQDAISISGLSKMYKTFNNPKYRILDLLGFGKLSKNKYNEFWALKDINLNIKKGSKVALVGRNGAGKSTLLKIISGTLAPTSGQVKINGKVSALMDLGTGFHPEFSGRENIFASLAYSGVVGKEAEEKFEEILDFSELEDFIENPVKTYSAGMYARLAFATSTAIVPEILIIDEILGAGDAYFINKSIERMKKLTEGGTTVLFVSHDITSVQKLCSEAIWIDKGHVVMEGHILDVTAEYLASIRKQEEKRLKARNLRLKHNDLKTLEEGINNEIVYCHLITENGAPMDKHSISKISLYMDEQEVETLELGKGFDNNAGNNIFLLIDKETINWSDVQNKEGRVYRNFENIGGSYQHASFAIRVNNFADLSKYSLAIEYKDSSKEAVKVEYYDGKEYFLLGQLDANNDDVWKQSAFAFTKEMQNKNQNNENDNVTDSQDDEVVLIDRENNSKIYGSGEIVLTKVQFLDANNEEKLVFTSGEYKKVRLHYKANQQIFSPVFVVAYYLLDGTCATQAISNKDHFEVATVSGEGYVDIVFDPLLLGAGHYLVSAAIFKELNLLDNVEPSAYDLHDKMYEVKIEQPFGLNVNLGLVNHPIRWGIKHDK